MQQGCTTPCGGCIQISQGLCDGSLQGLHYNSEWMYSGLHQLHYNLQGLHDNQQGLYYSLQGL